jgi:hypothetical protein
MDSSSAGSDAQRSRRSDVASAERGMPSGRTSAPWELADREGAGFDVGAAVSFAEQDDEKALFVVIRDVPAMLASRSWLMGIVVPGAPP